MMHKAVVVVVHSLENIAGNGLPINVTFVQRFVDIVRIVLVGGSAHRPMNLKL